MNCTLCARSTEINSLLLAGRSKNSIAVELRISKTSLLRHLVHSPVVPVQVVTAAVDDPFPIDDNARALAVVEDDEEYVVPRRTKAGRGCATCQSVRRDDIERALGRGTNPHAIEKSISKTPGAVTSESIDYHARTCVPDIMKAAAKRGDRIAQRTIGTVSQEIDRLARHSQDMVEGAVGAAIKDRAAAIMASKAVSEVRGKLTGELGADVEIRLVSSPQYVQLKVLLIAAISPFGPTALEALGRACVEAEGR